MVLRFLLDARVGHTSEAADSTRGARRDCNTSTDARPTDTQPRCFTSPRAPRSLPTARACASMAAPCRRCVCAVLGASRRGMKLMNTPRRRCRRRTERRSTRAERAARSCCDGQWRRNRKMRADATSAGRDRNGGGGVRVRQARGGRSSWGAPHARAAAAARWATSPRAQRRRRLAGERLSFLHPSPLESPIAPHAAAWLPLSRPSGPAHLRRLSVRVSARRRPWPVRRRS